MNPLPMSEYLKDLALEYWRNGHDFRIFIDRVDHGDKVVWALDTNDPMGEYFDDCYEAPTLYDALAKARELIEAANGTAKY